MSKSQFRIVKQELATPPPDTADDALICQHVALIHHHAPGMMSRGGVHPWYVRDACAHHRRVGILLDVVDDAAMERHVTRRVEIGDGSGSQRSFAEA